MINGFGMKYLRWIWNRMDGIKWNTLVRIVAGILRVGCGLLMVWLCRSFIDRTIRTGSTHDIVMMIVFLVLTVVSRVALNQVYYYMSITAHTKQTNRIRLDAFNRLFDRRLYSDKEMHSGDVSSRLSKDIGDPADRRFPANAFHGPVACLVPALADAAGNRLRKIHSKAPARNDP